jgi:hypothetical protein
MVFAGTAPIGGLFAGALAQAFGAPMAISVGAGLAVAVLGIVAWRLRSVRMAPVSAPGTDALVVDQPERIAQHAA